MEIQCRCELCNELGCRCGPYARFFSALGSMTRLHIINALRKGPKNVSQLVVLTGLEQTCVSHCLLILLENGFVSAEQEGKYRVYSLNKSTVEPLMKLIDDHVQTFCTYEEVQAVTK